MTSSAKRRQMDVMKLMMSDYQVELEGDGTELSVQFRGPTDTPYEGGVWQVHVTLPKDYPYRSPSIGFKTRMFHPNVDETSGSVCLDVINQTWTPMYDLVNIFDMFLPQLLSYPNASDPLNGEAASLLLRNPDRYKERVVDYVKRYASDHLSLGSKKRHPSTDSSSSDQTVAAPDSLSLLGEDSSSSTSVSSSSSRAPTPTKSSLGSGCDGSLILDDDGEDMADDLSNLSDSSDVEDSLVLDL